MSKMSPSWLFRYNRFIQYLKVQNYSENTLESMLYTLRPFFKWLEDLGILEPAHVEPRVMDSYLRHLLAGGQLKPKTIVGRISEIRLFFSWLVREGIVNHNPTSHLEMPRFSSRTLQPVLKPEEVQAVFNQPDITTDTGIRDRTILELFYACGIRRNELASLRLQDLNFSRETLFIHKGKGKLQRYVSLTRRALYWLDKYIQEVRFKYVGEIDDGILFLNRHKKPIRAKTITISLHRYILEAGITKGGSTHIFRRSLATSLLDASTDLRLIQSLLGHTKLSSTEAYVSQSIEQLKQIHTLKHPAKMKREDHELMA